MALMFFCFIICILNVLIKYCCEIRKHKQYKRKEKLKNLNKTDGINLVSSSPENDGLQDDNDQIRDNLLHENDLQLQMQNAQPIVPPFRESQLVHDFGGHGIPMAGSGQTTGRDTNGGSINYVISGNSDYFLSGQNTATSATQRTDTVGTVNVSKNVGNTYI